MIFKKTKINRTACLLLLIAFITACEEKENNGIVGLWMVEKVQVGKESMTPVARWTRFEAGGTQTSGNGWLQHSKGVWSLTNGKLNIVNENGIDDSYEDFSIQMDKSTMKWTRLEEGQEVTIYLERIDELPQSDGNRLIGLWKLMTTSDDGNNTTAIVNPNMNAMMHFRWDNTYVQYNMPKGKQYGIYKVHGHKSEIQLVEYGDFSQFGFWNFTFVNNRLVMTSTDNKKIAEFERIHQFLE